MEMQSEVGQPVLAFYYNNDDDDDEDEDDDDDDDEGKTSFSRTQ